MQLAALNESEGRDPKVVVLVDEYDRPVLRAIGDGSSITLAEKNLASLRDLFELIKSSPEVRFSFVTGSSRFTRAALFSGDNARTDISLMSKFSAICGFTLDEMKSCFSSQFDTLAESLKLSK